MPSAERSGEPGPLSLGQRLGAFLIVREMADGGMAVIYEAVHEKSGARAAVKVLRRTTRQHPEVVARFADEGRAASMASERTRGVVQIYDVGMLPDGTDYLIMELLVGGSLRLRIARCAGRPQVAELRLFRQLAKTLAAVHDAQVVHRDVKPENIFVIKDDEVQGGERTKLLDFGVAKVPRPQVAVGVAPWPVHTEIGHSVGSPPYMSPEQFGQAHAVTGQADVYSMGVMLFELCMGRRPFAGPDYMTAHCYRKPESLSRVNPRLAPGLAALVDAMLEKDPERRPTPREVVARLDAILAGAGRPRWLPLAGGGAVLALLLSVWAQGHRGGRTSTQPLDGGAEPAAVLGVLPAPASLDGGQRAVATETTREVARSDQPLLRVVVTPKETGTPREAEESGAREPRRSGKNRPAVKTSTAQVPAGPNAVAAQHQDKPEPKGEEDVQGKFDDFLEAAQRPAKGARRGGGAAGAAGPGGRSDGGAR